MVTTADLITLAFDPDLVEAGIAVACRRLAGTDGQASAPRASHMRGRVSQICLDLAFRRYLSREGIPHRYLDTTPFSAPQHQEIALGGRRCVLVSNLVSRQSLIARIQQEPGALLEAPLPDPQAGVNGPSYQPEDLYIFGFLLGTVTPSLRTLQKAVAAGWPVHLLHCLPSGWQAPRRQGGLGVLVLKYEGEQPITLELAGRGKAWIPLRQKISLLSSVSTARSAAQRARKSGGHCEGVFLPEAIPYSVGETASFLAVTKIAFLVAKCS